MSRGSSSGSGGVLWAGKPWVLPAAVAWSVLIIAVAVVVVWLELFFAVANLSLLNVPLVLWTGLVFFVVWAVKMASLALLRASHSYVLRDDRLEISSGILTSKSFVIVPSGFSDLEVIRSVLGRITGTGDIFIRSQSEAERRMVKVRHPLVVAEKIREVVAQPVVRVRGPD